MDTTPRQPLLIGWKEFVEFPDWDVGRVKAKIDTGARTSALDVAAYSIRDTADGPVAELELALDRHDPARRTVVRAPVLQMVEVCNTGGARERRPLLAVRLRIGRKVKCVHLTVTNRSCMLFRMILGRTALAGDFVVDVSQKYLLRRRKKKA